MANRRFSLLANRTEILHEDSANKNALSKRARSLLTQNIEEAKCEWYQKPRISDIPVTEPMLQEKAKRASEEQWQI